MGKTDPEQNILQELREHRRVSVSWDARLRHEDDEAECQILDISMTGIGIETEGELKPGIEIELDIPEVGVLAGKIVWSMGSRAGILLSSNPDTIRATLFSRARLEDA